MKDWLNKLFLTIDCKDAAGFVSFLTNDACFSFANTPVIHNKEKIQNAIELFFCSIKNLHHRILDVWEKENVVICEGEVKYTRLNDTELVLPFVNIFRMKGSLIEDYRVYIDISPLVK